MFLAAIALFAYASTLADYTDDVLARPIILDMGWQGLSGKEFSIFAENWYQRMASVSTQKYLILNKGQGLFSLSLSLSFAYFFLISRKIYSLKEWSTPSRRWLFILIAVVGIALILLGAFERNLAALTRGQLPFWADSIAIPLMYTTQALITLTLATFVLGVIQLFRAKLPVSLWIWHSDHPVSSWLILIFYSVFGLFTVIGLVQDIVDGAWLSIPGWFIWLYILASSRAAILSWYR